jgi:hypothetical protein
MRSDGTEFMRASDAFTWLLEADPELRSTVVAGNVAGPAKKMYLVGAQVTAESVFGPTMGSAANLTLMSYAGTCTIGITLDSAAVPDADAFVACLRWGFEEVCVVKRHSNRWNVSRSPTFVKELP